MFGHEYNGFLDTRVDTSNIYYSYFIINCSEDFVLQWVRFNSVYTASHEYGKRFLYWNPTTADVNAPYLVAFIDKTASPATKFFSIHNAQDGSLYKVMKSSSSLGNKLVGGTPMKPMCVSIDG